MADVGADTHKTLAGISGGDLAFLEEAVRLRERNLEGRRLTELGKLHEQGVLTDEEFVQQKASTLGSS